jgi:hypothetical protein
MKSSAKNLAPQTPRRMLDLDVNWDLRPLRHNQTTRRSTQAFALLGLSVVGFHKVRRHHGKKRAKGAPENGVLEIGVNCGHNVLQCLLPKPVHLQAHRRDADADYVKCFVGDHP